MGTPFGKAAKIHHPNGPEYQKMAEAALAKLKEQMSEIEFRAWEYRQFESKGYTMEKLGDWRLVWMMATNELSYPTQCECGGMPDREITCRLCQSIAHVSNLPEFAE
jgi:hypothetical protein